MKVILTTNIKKLGKIGDLVKVKNGYARNYLFPQNMALRENNKNKEYFEKIKEEIKIKENKKIEAAKELINSINKLNIEFKKESDEKDQLYGAVSKKEIINFFNEKNVKLISDDIKISQTIRSLGEHRIELNPYEEITAQLKVIVNKS